MHIALVNSEHPSPAGPGGIAAYVQEMANALQEDGHQVHVILKQGMPQNGYSRNVRLHTLKRIPIPLVPVRTLLYRFGWNINLHLEYAYGVRKLLGRIHRQYGLDVAEIPEYNGEGIFTNRSRIPLCVKFHTPSFLVRALNSRSHATWTQRVVDWMERLSAKRAHGQTAPSRSLASQVETIYNIPKDSISVIPYPVKIPARRWLGSQSPDRFIILCAGRLEKRKGFIKLIEILPELRKVIPGILVRFAGGDTATGPEHTSYLDWMRNRARTLDVEAHIEFTGPVNRETLGRFYETCDLFVIPSTYDNFPNTLLEAMAVGCPVAGSRSGGIPEIIHHNENGLLFASEDLTDLLDKICSMARDKVRSAALGNRARESAAERFSPQQIAAAAVRFYEKTINHGGRL